MSELFTNLARSTLASGITAGAVSLTVQSGDGNDLFPVLGGSDNFRCVLFKKSTGDIEIINVTARAGDVFTIARAQEQVGNLAATAFAFDAGDLVELRPTSAFYTGLAGGSTSANVQSGIFLYGVDTGAADVYTVAMNPTAASVTDGQEIRVKIGAGNTNTGIAATLQLDALATLDITMEGGGNPPSGSIKAGFVHTFIVNGTDAILQNAGLALTSSGFNALGKQIKNVAAGTAATDVATIGGTETHTNKKLTNPAINDSNGNEAIIIGTIASAVNEITITNAATGNRPTISTSGEADIGLDFENDQGEELLELVATASAVNNVRITNAATGNAAIIDCSETNGDLELTRNGTGDITVDSVPIYGLIILDTPELIGSATTQGSWVTINSATLNTANARKAIVRIFATDSQTTVALQVDIHVRKTGSADSKSLNNEIATGRTITSSSLPHATAAIGETVINLDGSYDFDYYIYSSSGTALTTVKVMLVGYYA